MGQPKGEEQGTKTPVDLRIGIDIDGFKGVYTNRDPGAIPREALQRARNVRIDEGMPVPRGGQEKILETPIDSAWDGICDVGGGANDGTQRLYVSSLLTVPPFPEGTWLDPNRPPIEDATLGCVYYVLYKSGSGTGGLPVVNLVVRVDKVFAGEANVFYSPGSVVQRRVFGGTSSSDQVLTITSGSAYVYPVCDTFETIGAVASSPSGIAEFMWADNGVIWVVSNFAGIYYFRKIDTVSNTVTLVKTYNTGVNNQQYRFVELGSDVAAVIATSGTTQKIIPVPAFTTEYGFGTAAQTGGGSDFIEGLSSGSGQPGYTGLEKSGSLYFPGRLAVGASGPQVLKVDSGWSTQSLHSLLAVSAAGRSARGVFIGGDGNLYVVYEDAGAVLHVAKFTGSVWTDDLGAFGASGQYDVRIDGAGRAYTGGTGTGKALQRSLANDYITAFVGVGAVDAFGGGALALIP